MWRARHHFVDEPLPLWPAAQQSIISEADGVARLAEGGSIAGGTAHLLDVVRTTVAGGVPLVDAVRAAATVPASIIEPAAAFGALEVGKAAQVLRADEQLRMIDGAA